MIRNWLLLCIFLVSIQINADVTNDFYYRPYPVLLVHGFNANNQTWNVTTEKDDKKASLLMTTKIKTDNVIYKSSNPSVTKSLITALSKNNTLPNPSTDPLTDLNLFKDFYKNELDATEPRRIQPWEEDGSYNGINHTYVELYGNYYYNEGDDGRGRNGQDAVLHPRFMPQGASSDIAGRYDISPESYTASQIPLGGQTSLVRLRIIQLLNEYYGDWKWVDDPTAKIKIVCHSNGGLIVTNALKLDDEYHADGMVSWQSWWTGTAQPGNWPYKRGFGFKLRDHIDQIITIDTPFKGSPMASKSGLPSGFNVVLTEFAGGATVAGLMTLQPAVFANAATIGGWTNFPAIAVITAHITYLSLAVAEWAFIGGSGTPVMADLAEDGSVVSSFKKTAAPTYTDGTQIPYINHIGRSPELIAEAMMFAGIGMLDIGAYHAVVGAGNLWNPVGWLNIARATLCVVSAGGWFTLGNWFHNSDMIVSKKSQDMKSVFPDSKRTIKKSINFLHGDQNTLSEKIPCWLSGNSTIEITNAITETQPGVDYYEFLPQVKPYEITYGCILPPCSGTNAETVYHQNHDIIRFTGHNTQLPPEEQWKLWPVAHYDNAANQTVITVPSSLGVPVKLVGHLDAYYMNSADVTLTIGTENPVVKTLQFNVDYGKWAGRFVDFNGDGTITYADKTKGSYFFCDISDVTIPMGETVAKVVLSPKYGSKITREATIKYGTQLSYFEANNIIGTPANPGILLKKVLRWGAGETKPLFIGVQTPITVDAAQNSFGLKSLTGETSFMRTSGNPGSGQYTITTGVDAPYVVQATIAPSQLKQENAAIAPDQAVHMILTATNGDVISAYAPFYIDNNSPTVKVVSPALLNDYDADGGITAADLCAEQVSLPPPQNIDCAALTDTIANPLERAMALSLCQDVQEPVTVVHHPECDGIDNDMDGIYDQSDKSEFDAMQFYSPRYDINGTLTDGWVNVDFETDDNLFEHIDHLAAARWQVFRVNGFDFNPASDPLIYTKELSSGDLTLQKFIADKWDYSPYTMQNPVPDGLYAIRIFCSDQAGNETYSEPAYFIVDKQAPVLSVLGSWRDESGKTEFSAQSRMFTGYARPALPSGKNDAPAEDVTVLLHPVGFWNFIAEPISATYPVTYADNVANNADGTFDPNRTTDGLVDPIFLTIPNIEFPSVFNSLWTVPIPDGIYSVEYVLKDKAGNEHRQWDQSRTITINRGTGVVPLSSSTVGEGVGNTVISSAKSFFSTLKQSSEDPTTQENTGLLNSVLTQGNTTLVTQIIRQDAGGAGFESFTGLQVKSSSGATIEVGVLHDNSLVVRQLSGTTIISPAVQLPNVWIKIVREGDMVKIFTGNNGKTWTPVETVVFAPGETIEMGTWYTHNSLENHSTEVRVGFGEDPFGLLVKYAIVSKEKLKIADRCVISGGGITANDSIETGCYSRINGNVTGGSAAFLRDNAVVNGALRIAKTLTRQNNTTVTGTITQNATVPYITIPTESTPFGTNAVNVQNDQVVTLQPGTYGDVHIFSRARVTLLSGVYNMKSFIIEPNVTMMVSTANGAVQLKVAQTCSIGDQITFTLTGGTSPQLFKIYSNQTSQFRIGCNVTFTGCITAPFAEVNLNATKLPDGTSRIKGNIQAKTVKLEPDVYIDATGSFAP